MNGKLGTLDQVEYFVNSRDPSHPPGYIILAPYSNAPLPNGYSREYADSISSVDRLQNQLLFQERRQWEREELHDTVLMGERQRKVVDSLKQKMVSSSTSPYERDWIAAYLQLREEKKEKHRKVFEQRTAYLWQTAHETPKGRFANEEKVNLDRMDEPNG
jgi:hypothetical protein